MKKKIQTLETVKLKRRAEIAFAFYIAAVLMVTLATTTCLAANDPLSGVNNLSNFIFSLIRAIGLILLGFGMFFASANFRNLHLQKTTS